MLTHTFARAIVLLLVLGAAVSGTICGARELSLEERVRAQEAIERVYYAHQIGATRPFEQALPRAMIEKKVQIYLRQSAALEKLWHTPVTAQALERELERMSRGTQLPHRLGEVYAALGNDPFLILECLARPALVDRLSRNFYASDGRFHAATRLEAERLRGDLARFGADVFGTDPRRSESEVVAADEDETRDASPESEVLEVSREAYAALLAKAGEIGAVEEQRGSFSIRVVVSARADRARVATFTVPKRSWDEWWASAAADLDPLAVTPVASATFLLPSRAGREAAAAPCVPDDTWDNASLGGEWDVSADATGVWTGTQLIVWGAVSVAPGGGVPVGRRYDPLTDTWSPVSKTGQPAWRIEQTTIWTGSEMIVWGGSSAGGGRYDPVSDQWTPMATSSVGGAAVWTGSEMIVWGNGTGGRYDPEADTWTPISTSGAPSPRGHHTAVWTGSEMIIWGGEAWDGGGGYLDTGGRYDPALDQWTPTSTSGAPSPRAYHTAVWTGSEMIIWGGLVWDASGPVYLDTGGRYDPALDQWTSTSTSAAPSQRSEHTAVWTGTEMIISGGENNFTSFETGGRYDPAADAWVATSVLGAPTHGVVAVWTGDLMLVYSSGWDEVWGVRATGKRYDPAADLWTAMDGNPERRLGHTAVWTGNRMILWGGDGPETHLDTGVLYDPLTDRWTDTALVNAPEGRNNHAAVWTGSEMVIWGGSNGSLHLSTGGRYDPLTDAWTSTSIVDAPSGRTGHTAVWTGSKMVVWGGGTDNTGGRYDPAADTWTPTSTSSAPPSLTGHTAVWTGSRMLVFGGRAGTVVQSSLYRYDPATDSWTLGSTVNGPAARDLHVAVWTGNEMIVYGGLNNNQTGGRYNPAANAWTPTSTVNAPPGKDRSTAVWTGTEMVVWGGATAPSPLNPTDAGGRYNPATNTWQATSLSGAPWRRAGHTAVWTGSHMIIWGGHGRGPASHILPMNDGGRYALGHSADGDGDGLSECSGDCNDADPGAFALPGEITGLVIDANRQTLEWDSAGPSIGPGAIHDVLRGVLGALPVGAGAESCVDSVQVAQTEDLASPAPGSGYWYLVRARNGCGVGSYGLESGGHERESDACP